MTLALLGFSCERKASSRKAISQQSEALSEKGKQERLHLLLITVDCLRYDRVGFGGYERQVSPHMDRLAKDGTVFTRAYSQSGWTLPSLATIHTGLYPRDHGAIDLDKAIHAYLPTLAERLSDAGYETLAYVSHTLCRPEYGLNRGFKIYDYSVIEQGHPHDISTSKEITDLALEGLSQVTGPFFLWIHYFDPHFYYMPHEGWEHFGTSPSDLYDQEVAYTDHHMGRLLQGLREKGLYDQTLIVLVSDHGEEFGEHGGNYHFTCFEEILRVPMVIRAPSLEDKEYPELAQQIDLFPTILGFLNLPVDMDLPGRDLFGSGKEDGGEPILFAERHRPPGTYQRAVLRYPFKLIVVEKTGVEEIPSRDPALLALLDSFHAGEFVYDLDADPEETRDLLTETDPEVMQSLRAALHEFSAGRVSVGQDLELSPQRREDLRSLGYMN